MKQIAFLLFCLGFMFGANLPSDFVDGNPLTAAELNLWKGERSGSVKPISANSLSYEDNRHDLGSGTYRWRDGHFSRDLRASGDAYISGFLYGVSAADMGLGSGGSVTFGYITTGGILEYEDLTITGGITIDSTIKTLAILCRGTFTLSGNIIGTGMGAAAGAGNNAGSGAAGSHGFLLGGYGAGGGGGGSTAYGGLGGGIQSILFEDLTGGAAGVPSGRGGNGDAASWQHAKYYQYLNLIGYGGGGGGGGGDGSGGTSGQGGAGGAGLLIVAKNLVIVGTPNISCAGNPGTSYTAAAYYGGGGGGGGGMIVVKYYNLTGTIPTLNVSGGAAGDGHTDGPVDEDGGIGGAGYSWSGKLR